MVAIQVDGFRNGQRCVQPLNVELTSIGPKDEISLAGGPKRMEKTLKFRDGPGEKINCSLKFSDFLAEIPRGTSPQPRPIIWYHSQPQIPKSNHRRQPFSYFFDFVSLMFLVFFGRNQFKT